MFLSDPSAFETSAFEASVEASADALEASAADALLADAGRRLPLSSVSSLGHIASSSFPSPFSLITDVSLPLLAVGSPHWFINGRRQNSTAARVKRNACKDCFNKLCQEHHSLGIVVAAGY